MLLEENQGHGFCPKRRRHAGTCGRIHPDHACVDLHLRGNDSAKNSKNLKLPTCASIFMQMKAYLKILRYGFFFTEGEKLSTIWEIFQNSNWFGRYGWIPNSNLPKLMKNLVFCDFIPKIVKLVLTKI
jgi:hypothetical protein